MNRTRKLLCTALLASLPLLLINEVAFPASEEAAASQIIARDVIVEEGDTFVSIARRELGKSGLAGHLADFNKLPLNQVLEPGTVVRIPIQTPVREEYATIIFAKGAVNRAGSALQRDDLVFLDDVLETGPNGFLSILFASGSVINLQPNTTARIARLHCLPQDDRCLIEIDAESGEIGSDITNMHDQTNDFRISTPYASAAVRGTVLDISASAEALTVGVTEGQVSVEANGQQVDVPSGFGSMARPGEAPSQPTPLAPAPVYRFVPSRLAEGDPVRWWALTNVNDYIAAFSSDDSGNAVVLQYNTEGPGLTLDTPIEAGDYFLSVRGVDEIGLKGFAATTRITVAAIDPELTPVNTRIERNGQEYLVSVLDETENEVPGYEIQVSTDAEFTDPLSVDISPTGTAIFKLDSDTLYSRARILIDPQTVSAFGESSVAR